MPYIVNGSPVELPEPVVKGDTTFVPVADLANALGGYVDWRHEQKKARFDFDGKIVWVENDNAIMDSNGTDIDLGAKPYLEEGVLWAPLRMFREAYDMKFSVNDGVVSIDRF